MRINSDIKLRGNFTAYIIEGEEKRKIIDKSNQIQWKGAHDIVTALIDPATNFPKLSAIITTIPQEVDPGTAKPKSWNLPFENTIMLSGTSFLATPSATEQQQVIVCQALFTDYYLTANETEGKYYEFALALNTGNALAYEYIPGGLYFGAGQTLQIVWTLYIGTA
jgi:hypothetical protein